MTSKIKPRHLEKMAYVYLRQSTMAQVLHHQESTERQYALRDLAESLGWMPSSIRVLDGDLGLSGSRMSNREDFKTLVADVSLSKVGAVFALEASRLSRNSADWNRLFEICSLTETLIVDGDGFYDPGEFNDQLLLGLKGMMSQAELHFIRARLQGGKQNKARKGTLRFPLPVGMCHDDSGSIVLDPDAQVRASVSLVFETFAETGSAYAVTRFFGSHNLQFPKRAYGGVWNGRLVWGRLTYGRVLGILKNPCYAGAYVYGRFCSKKEIDPDGSIATKVSLVDQDLWQVLIHDHHQGYIGWDEYVHNTILIQANQTNAPETFLSGPAREGLALLQGLLVCGKCGRRLTVRYKGNGGVYPVYECNRTKREGTAGSSCMHVKCSVIEPTVIGRVFEILSPDRIELAIKSLEELEKRNNAVDNQWLLRIQRADYDAQLAQKRYEEVDPCNRLVSATLEKRWNDALVTLEELKQQHRQYRTDQHLELAQDQKDRIRELATQIPLLWSQETSRGQDKKRMLRLLIKDITVERLTGKEVLLHVRWQGGAVEDISCKAPAAYSDAIRYAEPLVSRIRELALTRTDPEVAGLLNKEGLKASKGSAFSASTIRWIRYKHRIPSQRLKDAGELTVKEVAKMFDVSPSVVYYWIEKKYIGARKVGDGHPHWITLDPGSTGALEDRAHAARLRKGAVGGAV